VKRIKTPSFTAAQGRRATSLTCATARDPGRGMRQNRQPSDNPYFNTPKAALPIYAEE